MPTDYRFKTAPFDHQRRAFDRSRDLDKFALLHEPRMGKSKIIVDTSAHLYDRFSMAGGWEVAPSPAVGITGVMIVAAPGRVHRNWAVEEFPTHCPDRVPWRAVVWEASHVTLDDRTVTGRLAPTLEALLSFKGLAILCVNVGALITPTFRRYAASFFRHRRVLLVGDEYTLIMDSSGSKRNRVMQNMAKLAPYRRILDGTPGEDPLSYYAPFRFLDWRILGQPTHSAYKHHYAEWITGYNRKQGREFPTIAKDEEGKPKYQNLDELRTRMARWSDRVRFRDCFDVPEKVYQKRTFRMEGEQARVYSTLVDELQGELSDGRAIAAKHVLVRYLRMQQVTSGFWPSEAVVAEHEACGGAGCLECDDLGVWPRRKPLLRLAKENPRIELLSDVLQENSGAPVIVWARFTEDVDSIMALGEKLRLNPVRYDGRIGAAEKDHNKDVFQAGKSGLMAANQSTGGRGISFARSSLMVFYSNVFSLLQRLQSEMRADLPSKKEAIGVIDLLAEDTIDDLVIVPALRGKKEIADYVMDERSGGWL